MQKQATVKRWLHSNCVFLFVTSNALYITEDDSATQEEEQQIEKVLDATAVDTGESAAKSQGLFVKLKLTTMDGLTAGITLAKLRSLHTAAIQSL